MKLRNSKYFLKKKNYYLNIYSPLNVNFFDNLKTIFLFSKKLNRLYFFIISKNKILYNNYIKFYSLITYNLKFLSFFMQKFHFMKYIYSVFELKGVNFWFSLLNQNVFLDLGNSHFKFFSFKKKLFFFWLRKKKNKKLLLFSNNSFRFFSLWNFFWFWLRKVGPYKLKGFQFMNETIRLKEGKKPFK